MASTDPLLMFLILSSIATLTTTTTTTTTTSLPPCQEFIKESCNATSYPTLCFSSLSKYAAYVQQNPLHLAQVATNVSLSILKSAASTASSLYERSLNTSDTNATKALRDCTELLGDAVDNTKYSLSELKKINMTKGGAQMLWKLSNVQTYMSAVLTKEVTCTDGLKEMGAVVKQVSGSVVKAKKYTSNALGLVNRLRNS